MELADKLSLYLKCSSVDPRAIHSLSLKLCCLLSSVFLSNNLLNSYVSRLESVSARKLFEETPHRNVVTWSAMVACYARLGSLRDALFFFRGMQEGNVAPNKFTYGSLITGCTRVRDSRTGVQVHCSAVKFGVETDTFMAGALIDMYAKCGMADDCWRVFDQTPEKDVVSWTTLIAGSANSGQCGCQSATFELFKDMVCSGVRPVGRTIASLVKVFDEPAKLNYGKQAHGHMMKVGIEMDDHLGSALLAMYGRCGGFDEVVRLSLRINHDVLSLTSLLAAYMQNGYEVEAITVFRRMVEGNMVIDTFVIASVIGACSKLGEARKGKETHGYAVRRNLILDISVGNSLITFYGRCGEISKSELVFWLMGERDIISWTAMLTCYAQNDFGGEALSFFREMLREGISPPIYSVTGAIRACSQNKNLLMGRGIHARTIKMGTDTNLCVQNSFITMYAKCGTIDEASRVFASMAERDAVSWNALIAGCSYHGFEKEALELFHLMQKDGIVPDDYSFIAILASCSRGGLVSEGWEFFRLMKVAYRLEPKMEHYACMVDLLARAGRLHEAVDFIDCMPFDPDYAVWEALLASCKLHGEEVGRSVAEKILETRAEDASPCVTLLSIHASM